MICCWWLMFLTKHSSLILTNLKWIRKKGKKKEKGTRERALDRLIHDWILSWINEWEELKRKKKFWLMLENLQFFDTSHSITRCPLVAHSGQRHYNLNTSTQGLGISRSTNVPYPLFIKCRGL